MGRKARNHQPISTWVIRMAVNTEVNTPMSSVSAKPFTGPAPRLNMMIAATTVVALASMMVVSARLKPASAALIAGRPPLTSSRMRS